MPPKYSVGMLAVIKFPNVLGNARGNKIPEKILVPGACPKKEALKRNASDFGAARKARKRLAKGSASRSECRNFSAARQTRKTLSIGNTSGSW